MMQRILLFLTIFPLVCFSQGYDNYDAYVHLDLERKEGFPVKEVHYNRLTEILDKIEKELSLDNIKTAEQATNVCIAMSDILENDFGISYYPTELLSVGLDSNRLDCNYYSTIFYTVLRKRGQNAALVLTPGHMFLRWYYSGNAYINYETTGKYSLSDEEYIQNFSISEHALKNKLYMEPLSTKEAIACAYLEIANGLPRNDIDKQKSLYNKALSIFPNLIMAQNGLALSALEEGKTDEAIGILNKTIAMDTLNYSTYKTAGQIFQEAKRPKEALFYYTKGISVNPSDPQSYIYRASCYLDMNNVDAAMSDFEKGAALLKTESIFNFLFDYLSLRILEERIMEKYLELFDE